MEKFEKVFGEYWLPASFLLFLFEGSFKIVDFVVIGIKGSMNRGRSLFYRKIPFSNHVGGAAGAVSRITGTLGKGIAALTLDDDYQKKRREQLNKRPANVGEGFARGGKGLVMVSPLLSYIIIFHEATHFNSIKQWNFKLIQIENICW